MRMMTTINLPPWREPGILDDLVEMCRRSATTDVAVLVMGLPQRGAPFEGLERSLDQFQRIKKKLQPLGVRAGILIQSLIGHGEWGYPPAPVGYQRIVGWDGQVGRACFCPLDEGFLEHTRHAVQRMARAAPAFLLVDDDVRLDNHHPAERGCACPLHIAEFNRVTGQNLDRQGLMERMDQDQAEAQTARNAWDEVGRRSLLNLARTIRRAIDEIDPEIRCGKCASGGRSLLLAGPFARELAGKTRPMVRLGHGMYLENGYKHFAELMANHQLQKSQLADDVECLCEADTFPHTLYSLSRTGLRGLVAGTILASKIDCPYTWIPGVFEWVRQDWEAHADVIGRNAPFFNALYELARKTRWEGPSAFCPRVYIARPSEPSPHAQYDLDWGGSICGRLGIPFTVNDPSSPTVMVNGSAARAMTDQEMIRCLKSGLLLDGTAALEFTRRGYGPHLGVEASEVESSLEATGEMIEQDPINGSSAALHMNYLCSDPRHVLRLRPLSERVRIISRLVRNRWWMDPNFTPVAPAATLYENTLGGRAAVFAHDLRAGAMLFFINAIRRAQLLGVLGWMSGDSLPAVAQAESDLFLLFGRNETDREEVAALFNLSPDTQPHIRLQLARSAPRTVQILNPDGQWRGHDVQAAGNTIQLKIPLEPLRPLVVRLPGNP